MTSHELARLIAAHGPLTLDGALATHLETLGQPLPSPLWSAAPLIHQPSLVKAVHREYYLAGADIATTASYQATPAGLRAQGHSPAQARDIIKRTVELARQAREEVERECPERKGSMFVAGSVGPYGAYLADGSEYCGEYALAPRDMKWFHRERVTALLEAGANVLALETQPSLAEVEALLELLEEEFQDAHAWVSCTLRDEGHMSDGTPLEDLLGAVNRCERVVAVGVNCVGRDLVDGVLRRMRKLTGKALVAYPNSGEGWDAERKVWVDRLGGSMRGLGDVVREWRREGASLVGGCCRTGPEDVRVVRQVLDEMGD